MVPTTNRGVRVTQSGMRAVVTGAAGAIGQACCSRLLADGCRVFGVDVDDGAGEALVKTFDALDDFRFHRADVSVESEVEKYVHAAVEWMGGIDAFFNN